MANPPLKKKKFSARLIAGLIILAAVAISLGYRSIISKNPLSEDAIIDADVVHISTPVPGRVQAFHVKENARVKKGDLLFELDPTTYELRVRQAKAELAVALAGLDARQRQLKAEESNADIAAEQIARAQANLALTQQTLARLEPLAKKGYVTAQQLDDARTLHEDAKVSLTQAKKQSEAAASLVGNLDAAQALVEASQSAVAIAEKALADTKVYAPHDGLIVGLHVSSGEYVAPDQSLFTLINTDAWYATAFFRETDLASIRANECALVYALANPSIAINGTVESIGWGVSSADLIELPRVLPIVQKSLNWVRVAQRFPVRILLKDAPEALLRVGASATVVMQYDGDC